MVTGSLTIQRLTNLNGATPMYQVLFEDLAGNIFSGSMGMAEIEELLLRHLNLISTREDVAEVMAEVDGETNAFMENVSLEEQDLAGAGLKYLPQAG